jgi:hypothetical protein
MEEAAPNQDADGGEDGDIDPKQFREIPGDQVHHHAIGAKHDETEHHEGRTTTTHAFPDDGIPANLKPGGGQEDEPGDGWEPHFFTPLQSKAESIGCSGHTGDKVHQKCHLDS